MEAARGLSLLGGGGGGRTSGCGFLHLSIIIKQQQQQRRRHSHSLPSPSPTPFQLQAAGKTKPNNISVAVAAHRQEEVEEEEHLPVPLSPLAAAYDAVNCSDEAPQRNSPRQVRQETEKCYRLVHKLGRGVIYLGSSRVPPNHPHYLQAAELAREIATLLNCTTWTGAGPGLMDAATRGALEAKKPVGGFKIAREAGEWTTSNFHPYLPPETYLTCRFFSARKHGLVDAVVRNNSSDRTAVVALPGGIGTLDEVFEILALIQLQRIGSVLPVPFLLLNYDSYYSKLLDFLNECAEWGTVAEGEIASLWKVCDGNFEALEYLADFYNIPAGERKYHITPQVKQQRAPYIKS